MIVVFLFGWGNLYLLYNIIYMFYVDFIVSYIFKKFWFIFILKEVVFVVVLIFKLDEERII